jgi:adenylyl-sulfate kinase
MENKISIYWVMGPTSSGKTTIGTAFSIYLRENNVPSIHLDGDEVRQILGSSLGFSPEDRFRNVSLYVHLANKCLDAGLMVVVSALTAYQQARKFVYENTKNLELIFLDCPLDVCIERDSRGLYKKAERGEIKRDSIIGLTKPYIPPENPAVTLETEKLSIEESVLRPYRHFCDDY